MKKSIITSACIIAFTVLTIFSCKDKETTTPSTNNGVAGSFTWTENGGPVITADSAYWTSYTGGTGIRASKGGFTNYFEINWDTENNTSVGSKVLKPGDLTFLKGSSTYSNGIAQNLSVSNFSNNQLSGNFTVSVAGGIITTIVANFNALPKK